MLMCSEFLNVATEPEKPLVAFPNFLMSLFNWLLQYEQIKLNEVTKRSREILATLKQIQDAQSNVPTIAFVDPKYFVSR